MADPRVTKLAQVLVNYSLALKPGEEFVIITGPSSEELSLAVYKEALLAGAYTQVLISLPGAQEIFFRQATGEQLDHISPIVKYAYEQYDAILNIDASANTRSLSSVDPARMQRVHQASADLMKRFMERLASGELKWSLTVYPTNAAAQEADMSLTDYQDIVYDAGLLGLDDPVAAWREESARQQRLIDWLGGRDQVTLRGKDIDLRLSIKSRNFLGASGHENFPDGEIYTSPVEHSVNGWVRFAYPALHAGREVTDIELWFEDGKVIKESAAKGQDLLTALLDTDQGARYLGEWGIGTNYGIQRFTKNMLFDEKLGGTIHLAVGAGFPEIGSQNQSGLHWDMLCDMADSEITIDGELFYKDGKFAIQ